MSLDGTQLKEFRAVSPVGKHMVTRVYSRAAAGPALADYQHFYNHIRPHRTLDMMTPMEYLATGKDT